MSYNTAIVDEGRVHVVADRECGAGPTIYWMRRERRVQDNWAFIYAQHLAQLHRSSLMVVTGMDPQESHFTARRVDFLVHGLREVEQECRALGIPFALLIGSVETEFVRFVMRYSAGAVVADFSPLREPRRQLADVAGGLTVPVVEVDAHNIVPARFVSPKQEWAAYTIRPKINRVLERFLTDFPTVIRHPYGNTDHFSPVDWTEIRSSLTPDRTVPSLDWAIGGTSAGLQVLDAFLSTRLPQYHEDRNDPTKLAQSELSPWLNFGFISAQRVALEVQRRDDVIASQEAFLEELIVRRELSDNYCLYSSGYDSPDGYPRWASETLARHQSDPRQYVYSIEEFEEGETHDPLWNAAQWELVHHGKMHGYLRMYWAKKILEWSVTAEEAHRTALYLNDRHSLDGCDPNGYVGVAWSIGGVHDRPWFEREIFGKVRYMSNGGCRRKFDVDLYVETMRGVREEAIA